jgi:Ras-related protein Rab-11A
MQCYSLKFVLVGDANVGKSQLSKRFSKKVIDECSTSTVGMEFTTKELPFERCVIKAQIWDTAGQERFDSMTKAYYRDAVGALLVYDINNRNSFDNLKNKWLKQVNAFAHEHIYCVLGNFLIGYNKYYIIIYINTVFFNFYLVGNKRDGEPKNVDDKVSQEEAIKFAQCENIDFIETSAKDNINVDTAFRRLIFSVAGNLPAVREHLLLNGLPKGWFQLLEPRQNRLEEALDRVDSDQNSNLEDKPKSNAKGLIGDYISQQPQMLHCNYWTGEVFKERPSKPATSQFVYLAEKIVIRESLK